MKTTTYYQIKMTMKRGNGYGSYYLEANYKGVDIKIHTNDSEMWDWLNDDSDREKHREAKRGAYMLIRAEYENIKNQ